MLFRSTEFKIRSHVRTCGEAEDTFGIALRNQPHRSEEMVAYVFQNDSRDSQASLCRKPSGPVPGVEYVPHDPHMCGTGAPEDDYLKGPHGTDVVLS